MTTLGEGITRPLDIAANLAQVATGVDDQQVRDELAGTKQFITGAADFVVNGDYGQAAKNVHQAAVNETVKAMEGDVTATANVTQAVLAVATLRSATKGKPKITKENPSGPSSIVQAETQSLQKIQSNVSKRRSLNERINQRTEQQAKYADSFKNKPGYTLQGTEGARRWKSTAQSNLPKEVRNQKTKRHGNTLDDSDADFYFMLDRRGNRLKPGISQNADKRYSSADLKGGKEIKPIWKKRSRKRLERVERWFSERKDYPEDHTPWSGKRDPNSPNYDPSYIPKHLRK